MSFPEADFLRRRRQRNPHTLRFMDSILSRFSEPSTWRGLIMLAGALGLTIQPEYHEHIIALAMAAVGLINVFRRERRIPKAEVVE